MHQGAMLNLYPNSLGKNLSETVELMKLPEFKDAFQSFYILPTVFNSDIDGGYSIITYDLCCSLATEEDLAALRELGMDFKFDIILNHLSVLSPQFQDILKKGDASEYRDFFIDWNKFWEGNGTMGENGVMDPDPDKFARLTLRRSGYPILKVRFPDGRDIPYWNTFFQKVTYPRLDAVDVFDIVGCRYDDACALAERVNEQLDAGRIPETMVLEGFEQWSDAVKELLESRRHVLGQMDVNAKSPLVWKWYEGVMDQLASYGASVIRLDAFTGLSKHPGRSNFMDEGTWDILKRVSALAQSRGLDVIPEIHSAHNTGAHRRLWELGCTSYDYFLPVLLIDAMDNRDTRWLYGWAKEQLDSGVRTINMLGCHDGIPLRDPRGSLPDENVDALRYRMNANGGRDKMVQTGKPEAYQMDITYYSALGCSDEKLLLARAVQLFMPGKPQIWYMDLLAGENYLEVFDRDPTADNREINRRHYSVEEVREELKRPVVQKQLELLRFRNTHPAFANDSEITASRPADSTITLRWEKDGAWAQLDANFTTLEYTITCS